MCTANNIRSIPPEFMRAGRFDEVFFVDLPSRLEREEIWKVHIRLKKRDSSKFDICKLASVSENYSGAEIEKSVNKALRTSFLDGSREVTTDDFEGALRSFKPLYLTSTESVNFVKANTPDPIIGHSNGKVKIKEQDIQ